MKTLGILIATLFMVGCGGGGGSSQTPINNSSSSSSSSTSTTTYEYELIKSKIVNYNPDLMIMYDGWNDLSADLPVKKTIQNSKW